MYVIIGKYLVYILWNISCWAILTGYEDMELYSIPLIFLQVLSGNLCNLILWIAFRLAVARVPHRRWVSPPEQMWITAGLDKTCHLLRFSHILCKKRGKYALYAPITITSNYVHIASEKNLVLKKGEIIHTTKIGSAPARSKLPDQATEIGKKRSNTGRITCVTPTTVTFQWGGTVKLALSEMHWRLKCFSQFTIFSDLMLN